MPERTYKLLPKGPLHVGTWGIGQERTLGHIPSDTLFGALVVAWAAMDSAALPGRLESYLAQNAAPPFTVSSCFPYAGPVRFFPRPLRPMDWPKGVSYKRIKRATWVSEAIFGQLCRGQLPLEHLDETVHFVQSGTAWLTRAERESIAQATGQPDDPDNPGIDLRLWSRTVVPRVAVDRQSNASNLFYSGRLSFASGCGLWLAARGNDLAALETGLSYLQDAGVGGLRSSGHGAFEWQTWPEAAHMPVPSGEERFVTLSRYAPRWDEYGTTLRIPGTAFSLDVVAGWCQDDAHTAWRRRRVRLIGEGSLLGWPGHIPGRLVDVTPEGVGTFANGRRVYRYGLAFPVAAA